MTKIKVGILFGGRSSEHEVSLLSAKNVIAALDRKKYQPILIGIDKKGRWLLVKERQFLLNADNPQRVKLKVSGEKVVLLPGESGKMILLSHFKKKISVDVFFPVLHGSFGEDGATQGFLKLANVPFVGAGVLGSAVGMDKDVMKRLLRQAGIPVADFLVFEKGDTIDYRLIIKKLGQPIFIKPANTGSSVGISKVRNRVQFKKAIREAFFYDRKIIIEEFVPGRELECSVLGNKRPRASDPGEVIPQHEFYSYEAKYLDKNGALFEIPANISQKMREKIKNMAVKAFKVLGCEGMARVDFFMKNNGKVLVNEINTIPGFTKISMYPKLWKANGVNYATLIDGLIHLAIERFKEEKNLKTSYVGKH